MNETYVGYFNAQLTSLNAQRSLSGDPWLAVVRAAVDRGRALAESLGTTLRSDAAIFLTLNFEWFVRDPILAFPQDVDLRRLPDDIGKDINLIVTRAATIANQTTEDKGVISIHTLVDALHEVWNELMSHDNQIWDH